MRLGGSASTLPCFGARCCINEELTQNLRRCVRRAKGEQLHGDEWLRRIMTALRALPWWSVGWVGVGCSKDRHRLTEIEDLAPVEWLARPLFLFFLSLSLSPCLFDVCLVLATRHGAECSGGNLGAWSSWGTKLFRGCLCIRCIQFGTCTRRKKQVSCFISVRHVDGAEPGLSLQPAVALQKSQPALISGPRVVTKPTPCSRWGGCEVLRTGCWP